MEQGLTYRHLHIGVRPVGDNQLADVLASAQHPEGCRDVVEGKGRDWRNGLDVALADEPEELGENPVSGQTGCLSPCFGTTYSAISASEISR